VDAEAVADELYGLVPGEFTATRDARAAEARREGDRDAAEAIRRLRRPSTGAWLANLLVRRSHGHVLGLLEVGAAMRQAHADLAGGELRRLAERRHELIAGLQAEAESLAAEAAHPANETSLTELEATLEAASADPGAAEALGTGRLTGALRYSGLGPVEVSTATGPERAGLSRTRGPAPTVRAAPPRSQEAARPRSGRPSSESPRSGRPPRRASVAAAEADVRATEAQVQEANDERARWQDEIARLEAELDQLRATEAATLHRLEEARRAREAADRHLRAAAAALERARSTLEGQVEPPG
jgi:hypothetical protein